MIVFFSDLLCRECFVEKHCVLMLYSDFLRILLHGKGFCT